MDFQSAACCISSAIQCVLDTHMCQRLRQCVNPLPEQMTIRPTIVENEGKVNACPKLIAATGYTYVPTATPVCESPAGANGNSFVFFVATATQLQGESKVRPEAPDT